MSGIVTICKVIEHSGENEGFCISIESLPTYRGGQYWLGEMKIVSGIVQMLDRIDNEFATSLISREFVNYN